MPKVIIEDRTSEYKRVRFSVENKNKMTNEIKENILPVYKRLLEENSFNDVCTFCFQWGENYPFNQNSGFLFVGKAVNGWITNETDVTRLFDMANPERIFARDDQMEWVNNLFGNKKGYNTRKSAFWRLIKIVSEERYPQKWYSNIAWTNLYKIAPWAGGNPNGKLQNTQRNYCFEILKKEIELLTPKFVIFLTSGWEWSFINFLNRNKELEIIEEKSWGKYRTTITEVDGVRYIISHHPQGKNEWKHKNAIAELISENDTRS